MFGRLADWVARLLAGTGRWEAPTADPVFGYLVRRVADKVIAITGDRRGHVRAGGCVWLCDEAGMRVLRQTRPGLALAGACEPGSIWLDKRHPEPFLVLAHELAHLGLRRWLGGPWGGVGWPSEAECDAVAREAVK